MIYLVAGSAGFLGSHLTRALIDRGHVVVGVDDLSTGNIDNVNDLIDTDSYMLIKGDICDMNTLLDMPADLDGIFNFACPASPIHYQNMPIKTLMTNVVGVKNLLDLSLMHHCRILQSSTSEVYGDPDVSPQSESYVGHVNCYGPRACYDEGKRAAEALLYDYKRIAQVDTRIVRIFNTYGPNMSVDDGRVVSNFIVQALRGEDITMYGDGKQSRSFCYVDDLIRGIIAFFEQDKITGPMNLGNPGEFTMLELAQKVIAITKSQSKIIHLTLPKDDPRQRRPDITLAKSMGWEPTIKLDEGLRNTVDYFVNRLNNGE